MKRTNVVLDEKLLKDAVELTGDRTYSAAINRALDEMVRRLTVKRGIEELRADPDPWWPGYAEELIGAESVRKFRQKVRDRVQKSMLIADAPIEPARRKPTRKRRGSRR